MTITESQYAKFLEANRNLYATVSWRTCQGCGQLITRDDTGLWYNTEVGHYCPRTDVTADVYYTAYTAILRCSTIHIPERYTPNA